MHCLGHTSSPLFCLQILSTPWMVLQTRLWSWLPKTNPSKQVKLKFYHFSGIVSTSDTLNTFKSSKTAGFQPMGTHIRHLCVHWSIVSQWAVSIGQNAFSFSARRECFHQFNRIYWKLNFTYRKRYNEFARIEIINSEKYNITLAEINSLHFLHRPMLLHAILHAYKWSVVQVIYL